MKQIFKYLEPMWLGTSKKVSIRRVLALAFSVDFIYNTHHCITEWEIGKSYADVAMLLGLEAGLIAALLSLTTFSNRVAGKSEPTAPPAE
jgi:hypothetical protein